MTPPLVAAALLVASLIVIAIVVYFSWAQSPKWLKLPEGNRYFAPPGYPAERISQALALADTALRKHTTFPQMAITTVVSRVSILVAHDNAWVDDLERRIGGFAQPEMFSVAVGNDLSALFHELAHILEWYVHGAADDAHSRWAERGLIAGDEAFRLKVATLSTVV